MVLNLVSRKLFWWDKEVIEEIIRDACAEFNDENGEPYSVQYEPPYYWIVSGKIRQMKVEHNRIEIKHFMEFDGERQIHPYWGMITVDSDWILELDDQNEISDFAMVNIEIKSNVRRPEYARNPQERAKWQEIRNRQAAERLLRASQGQGPT